MNSLRQIAAATLLSISAAGAQAIAFSTFVSSADLSTVLSNHATIGFAYAGNKFVGSVYFGPNNNQLYATDLDGSNVRKFGGALPAYFTGENYVTSSLGVGGFGARDVFVGSQSSNQIYRIDNAGGAPSLFATLGAGEGVRSIAFDPYGLYGLNMLVATGAGHVYRVDNTGSASLLASLGEDTEGIGFAPQDFGPYAKGTLFTASEGSGAIRAIKADGSAPSTITHIPGAEMLAFVPLNLGASGDPIEGFYAAAYPNNVQKAGASEFTAYKGDIIVTDEGGHGVYQVRWNGATGGFDKTLLGFFPGQPEDGIFVSLDVIKPPVPEPGSWAMMVAGLLALGLRRRR